MLSALARLSRRIAESGASLVYRSTLPQGQKKNKSLTSRCFNVFMTHIWLNQETANLLELFRSVCLMLALVKADIQGQLGLGADEYRTS